MAQARKEGQGQGGQRGRDNDQQRRAGSKGGQASAASQKRDEQGRFAGSDRNKGESSRSGGGSSR